MCLRELLPFNGYKICRLSAALVSNLPFIDDLLRHLLYVFPVLSGCSSSGDNSELVIEIFFQFLL